MTVRKTWCLLAWVIFLVASSGRAQSGHAPVYKPLFPNAPKVRVDGRVRGADDALMTLTVLAPEHVGLTTKAQPSLFWYQSKSAKAKFELSISETKSSTPLLELTFDRGPADGIQRVRLAKHNIVLKPDVEYHWSVAMVVDEENRSKDLVASGVVKRIEPGPSLQKRLTGSPDTELPFIYADEGIWYDSLESLSDLIDKQPRVKSLHEERAVYFMQVGLHEAAMYEMKMAGKNGAPRSETVTDPPVNP
jgi:hypothetical protein